MRNKSHLTLSSVKTLVLAGLLAFLANILGGWGGSVIALADTNTVSKQAPTAECIAGQCFTDVPPSNPFYQYANNLYEQELVTGYACGGPGEPCDLQNRPYYRPGNVVTRQQMSKFVDQARNLPGIHIETMTDTLPLYSYSHAEDGVGISGESDSGYGVVGTTAVVTRAGVLGSNISGYGVWGFSLFGDGLLGTTYATDKAGVIGSASSGFGVKGSGVTGVFGLSGVTNGSGVFGQSLVDGYGVKGETENGTGVAGISHQTSGWAGYFSGNVTVTGTCVGCLGSNRIDHPLDPENKYLQHAAVESPDMKNIYDGNVTTDANGDAVVTLPDYFEAFNKDFRYQLTVVGQFAQAIVSRKVENNRFSIKTDKPNVEVSWQVTGIRHDPYAEQHRTEVTVEKSPEEQGLYLHPEAYGQPENKNLDYEAFHKYQQPTDVGLK